MFFKQGLIRILLVLFMSSIPGLVGAHDHEHSHDAGPTGKLELKQGAKWPTDAHLRQGMDGIRHAMHEKNAALNSGAFSVEQAHTLSKKVNEQVAFMVQNCKMDSDADAVFHLVLADIIAGADALAGQDMGKARQGAEKISHALVNYGVYFDHPGWH